MKPQMKLEHEVSFRWLLLFALPTIFSSIFANLYTTVDGIFVARWVDTDALSAINITLPMTYLSSALGIMFGTGGNALVAKKIGEGRTQARTAWRRSPSSGTRRGCSAALRAWRAKITAARCRSFCGGSIRVCARLSIRIFRM